ncbi:hypothetical protein [Aeromicrobium sp. CTD01-1L150]|uniref:hypothetical protein n=1 Tax=Aeromicrobium sp. CTD01-1L150 TaxID=3341830 RepID=UPI0035C23BFA
MSTPTPARRPKGSPTGGQFSAADHAGDSINLSEDLGPPSTTDQPRPLSEHSDHAPSIAARLAEYQAGDSIDVVRDGRTCTYTVQRTLTRADGGFGSSDHARLTVGFGPGRYNFEITAAQIKAGFVDVFESRAP